MGIDVLDHIIIGDKNYLSLKRGVFWSKLLIKLREGGFYK